MANINCENLGEINLTGGTTLFDINDFNWNGIETLNGMNWWLCYPGSISRSPGGQAIQPRGRRWRIQASSRTPLNYTAIMVDEDPIVENWDQWTIDPIQGYLHYSAHQDVVNRPVDGWAWLGTGSGPTTGQKTWAGNASFPTATGVYANPGTTWPNFPRSTYSSQLNDGVQSYDDELTGFKGQRGSNTTVWAGFNVTQDYVVGTLVDGPQVVSGRQQVEHYQTLDCDENFSGLSIDLTGYAAYKNASTQDGFTEQWDNPGFINPLNLGWLVDADTGCQFSTQYATNTQVDTSGGGSVRSTENPALLLTSLDPNKPYNNKVINFSDTSPFEGDEAITFANHIPGPVNYLHIKNIDGELGVRTLVVNRATNEVTFGEINYPCIAEGIRLNASVCYPLPNSDMWVALVTYGSEVAFPVVLTNDMSGYYTLTGDVAPIPGFNIFQPVIYFMPIYKNGDYWMFLKCDPYTNLYTEITYGDAPTENIWPSFQCGVTPVNTRRRSIITVVT